MPSAAQDEVLQAILERRAAEKRREMAPPAMAEPPVDLPFSNRITGAFEASEGMQEPSQALYEAKHQRAMDVLGNRPPAEPGFWETVASLGPRAGGGVQKMWQMTGAAPRNLWEDPLGTINSAGLAGQAATDAIVGGTLDTLGNFGKAAGGDTSIDPVKVSADMAGLMTLGAGAIPAEANSLRMGIKAYHGSPHDFERFDASKIGTGEGAQAYGHGLYFAEREGVAQDYRNKLTYRDFINESAEPRKVGEALFDVEARDGGLIDGKLPFGPTRGLKTREQIAEMFASGEASVFDLRPAMQKKITEHMKPPGSMYEVDIAAEPEQFLDWDKPLSEQSPQVQGLFPKDDAGRVMLPNGERVDPKRLRGGSLYRAMTEDRMTNPSDASQSLREAGIPGIKYFDQGSRDTGSGTRNYVIFDDKTVKILKKYGLPISAAGFATLSQLHPQEAQAAQQNQLPRY